MGFSVIVSKHEKSKNNCSCEPTHDQVQQETPHGVSGSHCEAQRQNLLCSRGYLPPSLNYDVPSTQPPKLWGCLLGGDRRGRDSLRLDRGPSGEASLHQAGAQDGAPARVFKMDQLGDFRVGQGRRREVRRRVRSYHYSRDGQKYKRVETERRNSVSRRSRELGRLNSKTSEKSGAFFQAHLDLGKSPNLKTHKPQVLKPQAASDKRPNLPLMVGGWAHSSQAPGSRTLDKV